MNEKEIEWPSCDAIGVGPNSDCHNPASRYRLHLGCQYCGGVDDICGDFPETEMYCETHAPIFDAVLTIPLCSNPYAYLSELLFQENSK